MRDILELPGLTSNWWLMKHRFAFEQAASRRVRVARVDLIDVVAEYSWAYFDVPAQLSQRLRVLPQRLAYSGDDASVARDLVGQRSTKGRARRSQAPLMYTAFWYRYPSICARPPFHP